jgi:hypothetical protein
MLDIWGYTHTHTERKYLILTVFSPIMVTRTRLGITLYAHCLHCYRYVSEDKCTSTTDISSSIITVPCPRQDGISNLSYPPSVPSLCSKRHNSRSFYNLKSTSEWMWVQLLGPQAVIWGFTLFMGSQSAVSRLAGQPGLKSYQEWRLSLQHICKICGIYTPLLSDRLWCRFS